MTSRAMFAIAAAAFTLAACATAEGYRQQMSMWEGRLGDDLMIDWGPPVDRSMLDNGRELWTYHKTQVTESEGYYRDETRTVTRTFTDRDGKTRTEQIQETFPVWQPPQTYHSECQTRFVIGQSRRIEQVSFEGNGCVAPES